MHSMGQHGLQQTEVVGGNPRHVVLGIRCDAREIVQREEHRVAVVLLAEPLPLLAGRSVPVHVALTAVVAEEQELGDHGGVRIAPVPVPGIEGLGRVDQPVLHQGRVARGCGSGKHRLLVLGQGRLHHAGPGLLETVGDIPLLVSGVLKVLVVGREIPENHRDDHRVPQGHLLVAGESQLHDAGVGATVAADAVSVVALLVTEDQAVAALR
jgi:hypothetical protein